MHWTRDAPSRNVVPLRLLPSVGRQPHKVALCGIFPAHGWIQGDTNERPLQTWSGHAVLRRSGSARGEALRAQARPPAYLIGQIDVSDPKGYAEEYLPKAREIIKAHGGRLLAAAGAAASGSQVVAIDGEAPKRVVIYVYPSMDALQAWRNDPEYVQVRRVGEKYAKYRTFAVEGTAGNSP